ncbi:hypothetical protein FZ983_24515 [Azospirillum sp. B21]|uniref:hypothetical protein n=1 Tax=unclassified Azospirillum TaxID=2630922 RepID=UPI0011F08326|nr:MULTISPECIES: hypothetical protein [unclassified Azospirillum]KAA0576220.1 hypothetical protein FZ983_24515 [Azospirillum sp. B21]MDR6775594.1 hypothetical protein [Azospirillum sp. BE72]
MAPVAAAGIGVLASRQAVARERPILHGAEYEGWIWWLLLNGLMDVLLVVAIAIAAAVAIRRIWRAIMDRRARGQKPMDREG